MARIRSSQYILEVIESFLIGVLGGGLLGAVTLFVERVQGQALSVSLLVEVAGSLLLATFVMGIVAISLWGYAAIARLLVKKGGCGSWIGLWLFWGIILGPILAIILDINTRLIVSRLYTGDKPLVYGLLFKGPESGDLRKGDLRSELLHKIEVYSEAMHFLATCSVFDSAAFERLDAILARAGASFGAAKRQEMIGQTRFILPTRTTGGMEELRVQLQTTLAQAFEAFNKMLVQISPTPETAREVQRIIAKYKV